MDDPTSKDTYACFEKVMEMLRGPNLDTEELDVNLAILNISAVKNSLWQLYIIPFDQLGPPYIASLPSPSTQPDLCTQLWSSCSNLMLNLGHAQLPHKMPYSLPAIHVLLVWLHSIHPLQPVLNVLAEQQPITEQLRQCVGRNKFPESGPGIKGCACHLKEDYLLKGFLWADMCFESTFLEEEDGPDDDFADQESRVERVLLRALSLASMGGALRYDEQIEARRRWETNGPNHSPTRRPRTVNGKYGCREEEARWATWKQSGFPIIAEGQRPGSDSSPSNEEQPETGGTERCSKEKTVAVRQDVTG
ncbi:unnamed protein product [Zymoseptoria tritici ST99CH_1A5]|uniref:Uncharacterized protein n=1 Tax=Zymoseptoria tritici ST99CH_1A5 TaxID=1276529 RepID=A0A1Y6M5Q1_ZYMTR|nr:unnamed protein product [Zymoseptoria tritici ST99CH_1A5]